MSDLLLSSTAQRAYWLGRYLERAGNIARLVSVNANLLIDLPVRLPLGWLPLIEILALEDDFKKLTSESEAPNKKSKRRPSLDTNEKQVVRFLLSDTHHPGSALSSLNFARENARVLRGTLPRATFEHINELVMYAKDAFAEPLSRTRRTNGLQNTIERLQQIDGFLSSTMMHDASWDFIRLGNLIERADMVTRIIDLRTTELLRTDTDLEPFEDIQWRSVLSSLDAMQGYTVSMQSPINQPDVLEFLLKNDDLPRSLLRCFSSMRHCLRGLPRNSEPLQVLNTMHRQLQRARVRNLTEERLHTFIDKRQRQLFNLHQRITDTYFPL